MAASTSRDRIVGVSARRVWDSRGLPTVEVTVRLADGTQGSAIAPAGASRGSREAVDLRDGGTRLRGMDVGDAVTSVNNAIQPALIGMAVDDQAAVDAAMIALDGTPTKERLGGNAIVATSLAVMRAAAAHSRQPLWLTAAAMAGTRPIVPLPEIQIFGGGAHAGRRIDIQDLMIMVPGATSFDEALEVTAEVYHAAGDIMRGRGAIAGVADEGGWWPIFDSNEDALETLVRAIERTGEKPGDRIVISLDIAASQFGQGGNYRLSLDDRTLDSQGMIDLLGRWIDSYPIVAIEDPLGEDDAAGWRAFTARFGDRLQIIGDDYLVTNAELTQTAIAEKACNAVLIKVNQIGTVSEALQTFRVATEAGWGTIVSARSGETEDDSISHLSTGFGARQLKVGSFSRSERMAKWNTCLRIADAMDELPLGPGGSYAAGTALAGTWWGQTTAGATS